MGREVPDDADVMLEEPQVDSRRVVVIEIAEDAFVEELTDLPNGPREEEGVIHHDLECLPLGQLDQLFRLVGGGCKGLFDERVLAVPQSGSGQFEVRRYGGHNGDGVDLGRGQQVWVLGDGHARARLSDALEGGRTQVANAGDLASLEAPEVAADIRTPITIADDADANP